MAEPGGPLMLYTRDPLVERRVTRAAQALGLQALQVVAAPDATPAAGLLVELGLDDALDVVKAWRAADPNLVIVGYLTLPDAQLWAQAEAAGADVTTRGLADRRLRELVDDRLSGRARARRIRLAAYRDFAGRLGYVGRIDESPAGPIAIFHIDNAIHAIADACPHAGASLCEGALEGSVITCARHGSQFDVTTGERVRGPADLAVEHFKVVVDSGEVFVELPGPV